MLSFDLWSEWIKSRSNRYLVTGNCRFFLNRFPVCFSVVLLSLVTPYLVVPVQPCMEWTPIKKRLFMRWAERLVLFLLISSSVLSWSLPSIFDIDSLPLYYQGLIQKEKVEIVCENKGAWINVVAKASVTQGWSEVMIMKCKKLCIIYICFLFSCYYILIMLLI